MINLFYYKSFMISKSELKRRKKIKKPELDLQSFSKFKQEEKHYKFYENIETDFSRLVDLQNHPQSF